jgi:SAM-dependent methyltransferase
MVADHVLGVDVDIENTSTRPLVPDSDPPIRLSYRWEVQGRTIAEGHRVSLPGELQPGAHAKLWLELRAPAEPGPATVVVTLVEEDRAWFDERNASAGLSAPVRIESPIAPTTSEDVASEIQRRFGQPARPYEQLYAVVRERFLEFALDDPVPALVGNGQLPPNFGALLDERVVEYPWLFAHEIGGRMLDAGSALNYPALLDRVLPHVEALHILTLAPEDDAQWARGVSYVFADMRNLPYREEWFDTVVCISTLEHIGMDNSIYGVAASRANDPSGERIRAIRELRRVLRKGGSAYLTFPYGRATDHGWMATLDRNDVDAIVATFQPSMCRLDIYRCGRTGWSPSTPEAVALLAARDSHAEPVGSDLVIAARGLACLHLVR